MSEKTDSGRDEGGRFAPGNPGGPGNPFARKTAALRKAAADSATAQDVAEVMAVLKLKAQSGDVAAIRLWLAYTAGKPGSAADPDTLDAHELRVRREAVATAEDLDALTRVHAPTMVRVARVLDPAVQAQLRQNIADDVRGQPAPEPPTPNGRPGLSKGLAAQLGVGPPARKTPTYRSSSVTAANGALRPPKAPTAPAPVSDGGRRAPSPNGESGGSTSAKLSPRRP